MSWPCFRFDRFTCREEKRPNIRVWVCRVPNVRRLCVVWHALTPVPSGGVSSSWLKCLRYSCHNRKFSLEYLFQDSGFKLNRTNNTITQWPPSLHTFNSAARRQTPLILGLDTSSLITRVSVNHNLMDIATLGALVLPFSRSPLH